MNIFVLNRFALELRADGTYTPFSADAWKFAGEMTLLGVGMVFAVLAVLWAVLATFKLIFAGRSPKSPKESKALKQEKKESLPSDSPDDVIAAVIAASVQAIREDETQQLVAVITAAVAAYRNEEGEKGEFRVVSFKRAGSSRSWNRKR